MPAGTVTNDEVYPDAQDLSIITVLAPKRMPVPPHVNINCIGTQKSNADRMVRFLPPFSFLNE